MCRDVWERLLSNKICIFDSNNKYTSWYSTMYTENKTCLARCISSWKPGKMVIIEDSLQYLENSKFYKKKVLLSGIVESVGGHICWREVTQY